MRQKETIGMFKKVLASIKNSLNSMLSRIKATVAYQYMKPSSIGYYIWIRLLPRKEVPLDSPIYEEVFTRYIRHGLSAMTGNDLYYIQRIYPPNPISIIILDFLQKRFDFTGTYKPQKHVFGLEYPDRLMNEINKTIMVSTGMARECRFITTSSDIIH